jgi:hypothetical protein
VTLTAPDEGRPRRDEPEDVPVVTLVRCEGEWRTFRSGAASLRAAVFIVLLAAFFSLGARLLLLSAGRLELLDAVGMVEGAGGLCGGLVWLVGLGLLCGVPARTGLRPLALVSLAAPLLLAAGAVVGLTVLGLGGPGRLPLPLFLAGCLLLVPASLVCSFLLLRSAARQLGDAALGGQFVTTLVLSVLVPCVLFGAVDLLSLRWSARGALPLLLTVSAVGLTALWMLSRLLTLLDKLVRLCDRAPPGPPLGR